MIAPIVSKTALTEQKQDALNTSVSVVAPEMQYNRSKSISHTFFTLLPTKGGVAGDVDGGYIQCISVQTLIFRLVMNFIRPKTLRSALWRCPILQ